MERPETTENDLKQPTTSKKRPATSKKWLETIYNKQETTWNDLEQPRAKRKQHEVIYCDQETT